MRSRFMSGNPNCRCGQAPARTFFDARRIAAGRGPKRLSAAVRPRWLDVLPLPRARGRSPRGRGAWFAAPRVRRAGEFDRAPPRDADGDHRSDYRPGPAGGRVRPCASDASTGPQTW